MKKIVIMSDNHGNDKRVQWIKQKEPDGDFYVHCGDSEAYHVDDLDGFLAVLGNNDWDLTRDLPKFLKFKVDDISFLVTHGQYYGYYNREKRMIKDLKKHHCTVMISGHSHMPLCISQGRYTFINPGSTDWPRGGTKKSYAVVYVEGSHLKCEIKEIEE